MLNENIKKIHCIGIGGIGVSALAELLLARGYQVSGSDITENNNTVRLAQLGIRIVLGHCANNVSDADCVVYSSAINPRNPEFSAAQQQSIPVLSRGEVLAQIVKDSQGITVAGTHGKTTTTGLIAHVLMSAGYDPSFAIGGIIQKEKSPVHTGQGKYFVAEVDESDASFLFMRPQYAVLTNVDTDHLETYGGNFSTLQQCFLDYLSAIPENGAAFVCIDDPVVRDLIPKIKCRRVTYGFSEQADVRAFYYRQNGVASEFNVRFSDQEDFLPIRLKIPGSHNVQNALAAIALARELSVPFDQISAALATFPGMGRRFHGHGEMHLAHGRATVIEDYGHHPREIKATLDAAKMAWPNRRVVLVFQPHRFSRTRDLYAEFIEVLGQADKLYLLDIYSAGEAPLESVSSQGLAREIAQAAKACPDYVADLQLLPKILHDNLCDDDVVILQGAGSIGSIAPQLLDISSPH